MTTQLALYNNALLLIGERNLASLAENREPRRVLDAVWNDDAIKRCLEQGSWNFAIRTVRLDYEPSIQPDFGYQYAFEHPDDYVRLLGLSLDEYFNTPNNDYADEAGYWYASNSELYVRYVSMDASYGGDLSRWPGTFCEYVEHYLASKAVKRLTNNQTDQEVLKRDLKRKLTDARSKDALNDPVGFPPPGNWTRSRMGGNQRDGGNRNKLIG